MNAGVVVNPLSAIKAFFAGNTDSPDGDGGPLLTYSWFKVNPSVLNPIFGVSVDGTWNTDQLLCNCQFDVKVARNLSYDGMPY